MSTFAGKLNEFPGISIDRFDEHNWDSKVFFLSHCHTDHMVGLENPQFHKNLLENECIFYLSPVSAEIIKDMYPSIAPNLRELDFHSANMIKVGRKSISVTPIPAGHCPGSIMLLFEGNDDTVLYTGDYRINPADIPKFKAFYDSYNNKKRIDSVYLDTTFFLKVYDKFPARSESLNEICGIIKDWITRSDKHVISLKTSAKYGYEYLFIEIYKQLKMPVHVNEEIYDFYCRVPEMDNAVTKSKNETKIHSACGSTYEVICLNTITYKIKNIRISAFRWRSENLQNGISESKYNNHYVCYSTHASYEEGVELLKFLAPKRIVPNVLHNNPSTNAEIYHNIEEILDEPQPKKVKLFNTEETQECKLQESCTFDESELSILDSPPRKFKA